MSNEIIMIYDPWCPSSNAEGYKIADCCDDCERRTNDYCSADECHYRDGEMKEGVFVGVRWIRWEDVNKAEEIWKKRGVWCESRQMEGESYYELLFNYEDFPNGKLKED